MGEAKPCDVYRLDWMTRVSQGQNLFRLVSNSGTAVQQVHGAIAEDIRDVVKDTLVPMPQQFNLIRADKMKLSASCVSLPHVSHMRAADISQDKSNTYTGHVIVP